MPPHANFAAVIAIKQTLLQELVRIFHHANQITHRLDANIGLVAVGFFLDIPELICSAANADRLALNLRAWGPMTITLPDSPPETRQVLFTATVLANPQLSLQNTSILFAVDGMSATVETMQILPLSGQFSPPVQLFLASPIFRDLIQLAVRIQLASMQRLVPPISVSFLGDIANASNTTLTPRVLDGVLVIGLDVDEGNIQTTGNPNLLTDVTAGNDIAMWQNPAALPLAMARIYQQVADQVAQQGATLDNFSLTVEEGHFHLAGVASKTGGSVTFSMNAVPRLIRYGQHYEWEEEYGEHFEYDTPDREELWFEMQDVNVDVDRDWWVVFLDVLGVFFTLGFGTEIVESYVDMVRDNVAAGITSSSSNTMSNRNQYFTFANTAEPVVKMRLEDYECHLEGVYTGITLSPQFPKPLLKGYKNHFIEGVPTDPPQYSLRLPFDVHPEDPQMRVRWTVRRLDSNEIVLLDEGQIAAKRDLSLISIVPILLQTKEFLVECRVYRVLGPVANDFFNASRKLSIGDTLDRSHPYVRWFHWLFVPIVQVETDGSKTVAGYKIISRMSDIHRTDFPGRCKMASRYSLAYPNAPRSPFGHPVPDSLSPSPYIEYLDNLPFPREELMANRARVCDYCFFGGPTKTTPLIP